MVTPLFFVLLFGVVEFSLVIRDYSTLSDATEAGVRAASVHSNSVEADWLVLRSIRIASEVVPDQQIERIVIYRASTPGQEPPTACKNGIASAANHCNVYSASDWQRPVTDFGCLDAGQLDSHWCPITRNTTLGSEDLIGVWVEMRHEYVTGFFGDTFTMTDSSTLALEPNRYSASQ